MEDIARSNGAGLGREGGEHGVAQDRVFGQRYRVLEVLGDGGMARVYKALDERLGRVVAVKTLHAQFNTQDEFVARFEKEAQFAASLGHPNIIGVYDIGRDGDGTHYIVMEYVEGENLKSLIRREAPLTLPMTTAIIRQLCLALDYAHERGVVHRDIKPENIFLTPTRQVKVGDFGIARALDSTGMTSTGQVLGSVSYFSPEQAQGQPATSRSDLYSTGIVLYEMLTRQLPFQAENALAVAMKHITEAPIPPSGFNPRLSPGIDAVVLKTIAKDPARRYRTGAELAAALSREGSAATPSALPPREARAPRDLAPSVAAAGVGVIAARDTYTAAAPAAVAGGSGRLAGTGVRAAVPRAVAPSPLVQRRRRTLAPFLVSLLLLGALGAGVILGRDAMHSRGGAPPSSSHGISSGRTPTVVSTAAATRVLGAGGSVAAGATPSSTAAPTATAAPASPTAPTATRTPRPAATATSTAQPLAHARADLTIARGFTPGTFGPVGAAESFPIGVPVVYGIARWQGVGSGHRVFFRWTLPNGDHGSWGPDPQCKSENGVCFVRFDNPSEGTYRLHLYIDTGDVAQNTFVIGSSAAATATPPPPGAGTPPGQQKKKGSSDQGGGQGDNGQSDESGSAAAVAASSGGGLTAQVTAAIQRADAVYRMAMATLDAGILPSAFGPYLTAVNESVIAGYRASGERLLITPHGGPVIQQVTSDGPDQATAIGYKTETAVVVGTAGQVIADKGTATIHFIDTLRRVGGRWLVERVTI